MKSEIYTVIDEYRNVLGSYTWEQEAIALMQQHANSYICKNTLYNNPHRDRDIYKYMATDKDGTVVVYSDKPVIDETDNTWVLEYNGEYKELYTLPDSVDDWKDSLVEI